MKWFNEKGASLGFFTTAALLAAIILCAPFVSCGRTHGQSGVWSRGSGVKDKNGNTSASVPDSGLKTQDSGLALDAVLRDIDAYQPPKSIDAARFASLKAELKRLLVARASQTAGRDAGSTKDISVEQAASSAKAAKAAAAGSAPAASGTGRRARQTTEAKTLSIAPAGTMNAVTDLTAVSNPAGTQATLMWTEVLPGDYDNDGEVSVADIIPVALYYGQDATTGPDDAHRLVSGDFNPEINIWDMGAIAANYDAHLDGYQVWRGHWNGTSTDWETTFGPNPNPANPDWSADRPSHPPVSTRPSYTYTNDISGLTDKDNVRYKVTAYGDGAAGTESNEATMPPPTYFSVSGTVTQKGGGALAGVAIKLTPGGQAATSGADGTYTIPNVPDGDYTLTPSTTGYWFAPPSRQITVSDADMSGQDFEGTVGGLATSPWPKFHGNAQNTGQSPYIGAQMNHVKWTFTTGRYVESSPAVGSDGSLYFGSYDCKIYALDDAGGLKWVHWTNGEVLCSPAIAADGTVYIGNFDTTVFALNPVDGSTIWTRILGGWDESPVAVDGDGTVYAGCDDYKLYALNPADGSTKWTYTTGSAIWDSVSFGADGTIYIGSLDNNVYALNATDGSVKWVSDVGSLVRSSPAVGADGTVFAGTCWPDNKLYALSPPTVT